MSDVRRPVLAVLTLLSVTGCAGAPAASTSPTTSSSTVVASPVPSVDLPSGPATAGTSIAAPPSPTTPSKVVVLDPGHNGGNASHPEEINAQVPAGRGRMKACNTTGTATNAGFPEHEFAWDVAVRVRDLLAAQGVQVVMTRQDDTGVGPCVDKRAAIGNDSGAAAVVSIHADGSTNTSAHGFHVAYSSPPLNEAQGEPSTRLATTMRDAMVAGGFVTSTYIGSAGLSPRDDLSGLNLSTRPAVLVECGNMRNATEAAAFSSPDGRQSYASAIAAGILAYLG